MLKYLSPLIKPANFSIFLSSLALLCFSISYRISFKQIEETLSTTLFLGFLIFIVQYFRKKIYVNKSNISKVNFYTFLIIFAYVNTINALTYSIDTDIPRLRFVIKMIYYSNFALLFKNLLSGRETRYYTIWSLLLFLTIPFANMLHFGSVKSLSLFLFSFGILIQSILKYPRHSAKYFLSEKREVYLIVILLTIYAINNLVTGSLFASVDQFLLLSSGFLIYIYFRFHQFNQTISAPKIIRIISIIMVLQVLLFTSAIANKTLFNDGNLFLLSKYGILAGANTNDLGFYFLLFIPFFFYNWKSNEKIWSNLNLLYFLFFLGLLCSIRTRSALGALFLSYLFFYLYGHITKFKKVFLYSSLISVFSLPFLFYFYPSVQLESSLRARVAIWHLGVESLKSNFFLGVGAGNFDFYIQKLIQINTKYLDIQLFSEMLFVPIHNVFIQWWLDGGILFLIFLLIFFVFRISRLVTEDSKYKNVIRSILLAVFIHGLFNYTFMVHVNWINFCIILSFSSLKKAGTFPIPYSKNKLFLILFFFWIPITFTSYLYSELCHSKYYSLEILKPMRVYSGLKELVLDKNYNLSNLERINIAQKEILNLPVQIQQTADFSQILGELYYTKYVYSKDFSSLKNAEQFHLSCVERSANPSFCLRRLIAIKTSIGENRKTISNYENLLLRLDPLNLTLKAVK